MADHIQTRSKNASQRPGIIDLPAPRKSSAQVAEESALQAAKLQELAAAREALNLQIAAIEAATQRAEDKATQPFQAPSRSTQDAAPVKPARGRKGAASKAPRMSRSTATPVLATSEDNLVSS